MKMKKFLAAVLAASMVIGMLAGCGSDGSSESRKEAEAETEMEESNEEVAAEAADSSDGSLTEFKMTYVTWVGCAPLFIAQEKGFFEEHGIKPELILNEDESSGASLLYSNSVQAGSCVMDKVVLNYANGSEQMIALIFDESTGGDGIIASEEIQSVEDLKGKKVGIDFASTEYFFLHKILMDHGMTFDDLDLQDMDASSAGASFIAGDLDAAVVWEPWLTNASQRDGGHVLVSSADYPRVIMDSLTVSRQFAEEQPEAIEALKEAWCDAIDYYNENPEECVEIMARGLDLTVEDMEGMLPSVTFMGREENAEFFNKANEETVYSIAQDMADFWADINPDVPADLDLTDLIVE